MVLIKNGTYKKATGSIIKNELSKLNTSGNKDNLWAEGQIGKKKQKIQCGLHHIFCLIILKHLYRKRKTQNRYTKHVQIV